MEERIPDLGTTLGKALLAVHRSYLGAVKPLLGKPALRGMSHITGGGIVGNTMRVVPKGLTLNIDWEAWKRPAIYGLIQRLGDVPEEDMRKTFNLGIGLILIVAKGEAGKVMRSLQKRGEKPLVMGGVLPDQIARLLAPEGALYIQTDVEERAEQYEAQVATHSGFVPAGDAPGSPRVAENPFGARSPREHRAIADGLPVHRLLYRRAPRGDSV